MKNRKGAGNIKKNGVRSAAALLAALSVLGTGSSFIVNAQEGTGQPAAAGSDIAQTAEESTAQAGTAENTEPASETTAPNASGTAEKTESSIDEQVRAFYNDSVFVGDSIMLGFRRYSMKHKNDAFLKNLKFLAAGSYSVRNALVSKDDPENIHPVYQGEKRCIWESISLMKGKRIFIMLGMNDLNLSGIPGICDNYKELIGKIKESNPDSEIYIMGMTYVLHGAEKGRLRNDTIREYNSALEALAAENGWHYLNLADTLADKNGDLAPQYCSDGFVHQSAAAYAVWEKTLKEYALEQIMQQIKETEEAAPETEIPTLETEAPETEIETTIPNAAPTAAVPIPGAVTPAPEVAPPTSAPETIAAAPIG